MNRCHTHICPAIWSMFQFPSKYKCFATQHWSLLGSWQFQVSSLLRKMWFFMVSGIMYDQLKVAGSNSYFWTQYIIDPCIFSILYINDHTCYITTSVTKLQKASISLCCRIHHISSISNYMWCISVLNNKSAPTYQGKDQLWLVVIWQLSLSHRS